ncbi:MAG: type II secretion system protein [Desulfuromonadales bacterium]|nr:type II secretion system protein [Desulfuromonadales bacterium]MDW7758790.1 type II secretion system protein [Desulfuromonadales bacterium]
MRRSDSFLNNCRGVTLVELVIAMVVVSIALGGVLLVMNYTTARSADPLLQRQAVAIAEAYLEEILLKPYVDPDGVDGEGSRALYDDVDDYDGLADSGARDQSGAAIAGLANYTVNVSVQPATVNGVAMLRAQVMVGMAGGGSLTLAGYRANY